MSYEKCHTRLGLGATRYLLALPVLPTNTSNFLLACTVSQAWPGVSKRSHCRKISQDSSPVRTRYREHPEDIPKTSSRAADRSRSPANCRQDHVGSTDVPKDSRTNGTFEKIPRDPARGRQQAHCKKLQQGGDCFVAV